MRLIIVVYTHYFTKLYAHLYLSCFSVWHKTEVSVYLLFFESTLGEFTKGNFIQISWLASVFVPNVCMER